MAEMAGIYQDYGGSPQAITDLGKLSEMGAKQQELEQNSQLLPGRLKLQETLSQSQAASALHNAAQYQKIMTDLSQDELMGNLVKKYSAQGMTPSESLFSAADEARKSGLWRSSLEAAKAGSIQYSHEMTGWKNQLDAQEAEQKLKRQEYQEFASEIALIRTQEDFDDFNANAALKMGRPVPWPREYNPEVVAKVQDFARNQRERDEVKEKAQERILRQKLADQANRARIVAAGIAERGREARGVARQTRVYEPTKSQLAVVDRLVQRDHPNTIGAVEAEAFNRGVAHEAYKRTAASNGATTYDEEVEKVYEERKDLLTVQPPEDKSFLPRLPEALGGSKPPPGKLEYMTPRSPGGKLNPLPMTLDARGQYSIPKDKRVSGRWYNLGKNSGGVRRWIVEGGEGGWEDLY